MKGDIETIIEYIARSEGYDDGPALDALRRIRGKLERLQRLRQWHEGRGFDCVARSEGQDCCVDLWLADGVEVDKSNAGRKNCLTRDHD